MASNFPDGFTLVDPGEIPKDLLQSGRPQLPEGFTLVDPKDLPKGLVIATPKGTVPYTEEEQRLQTFGKPGTELSAGVVQGALRDPGLAIARGVSALGEAVPPVATDAAAAWEQSLRQARADYEAKYGKSPMAGVGRVIGSAIPAAAAGGVVNAALRPLPVVGNMLTGGSTSGPIEHLASSAAQGIVQGGLGAAVSSGQSDEPFLAQVGRGGMLGAVVNPLTSTLAGIRGGLMIDPESAQLARAAVDKGIPLRAAQLSRAPSVRYLDAALRYTPFSGYESNVADAQAAFNRRLNASFGEDADKLTSQVLNKAADRIGPVFERVGAQASLDFNNPAVMTRLADIEAEARMNLVDQDYNVVQRHIDNVVNKAAANNGVIPGPAYLALVKKHGPLYNAIDMTNSNISKPAMEIKDLLDDVAQQSLPPSLQDEFRTARIQYKNFITARPLAARADTVGGAAPSVGDVSPAALLSRVNQVYGADNVAMGRAGELGELAAIGQRFLKEPSSSGTPEKSTMINLLTKAGSLGALAAGGGYGLHTLPPELGVPAIVTAGAALPAIRGVGGMMQSPSLRDSIISSSLGERPGPLSNLFDLSYRYGAPAAGIVANQLALQRPDTLPYGPGVPLR